MNLSEVFSTIENLGNISISIEIIDPEVRNCRALVLPQDQYLHHCEACRRFKLSSQSGVCIANKARSIEIARKWKRPFRGFCPNRIWDLAVPVCFHGVLVSILYLGGLKEAPSSEQERELKGYGEFLRQFIVLELQRYARILAPHRKRRETNFYLANTLQFIEEHYSADISLAELARMLKVAPEYLGKIIASGTGQSFRQLLTARRLKQAEILVRLHHTQSFAQVAAHCGFRDSNYFSVVFKKHFGVSPKVYRNRGGKTLPDVLEDLSLEHIGGNPE